MPPPPTAAPEDPPALRRLQRAACALAALLALACLAPAFSATSAMHAWSSAALPLLPFALTLTLATAMTVSRQVRAPALRISVALAGYGAAAVAASLAAPTPAEPAATAYTAAGAAAVLAFSLLIVERTLAATPHTALREAPSLRALAFAATGVTVLTALAAIARAAGLPYTAPAFDGLTAITAAIPLELALRAAARLFLPRNHAARGPAPVRSLIARTLAGIPTDAAAGGWSVQFSRSWALAYMRAAALPMLACLLLAAWLLSAIKVVPLDTRAIAERFGAPAAVLHPGLHAILPWPMGAIRAVEFGAIHQVALTGTITPAAATGAEDPAPASADRLWNEAHPEEIILLIASHAHNTETFEALAADIRVLYRTGLTDQAAIASAYGTTASEALVRAEAGRAVTRYFAGKTLDAALVADREQAARAMRATIQQALDARHTGLNILDVTIEAIHPPAGAADAYHNVRAAEIASRGAIAAERGNAATIAAQAQQYAFDQKSQAQAAAAEEIARARTASIRFAADSAASHANAQSFALERYLSTLTGALAHAPKTIIDHRLNYPEAPVLDLRPLAPASAGTGAAKEE